ncbi:DNA polymerase epsilon subunit 2-like [Saccoglossus kowalevskii]|uniref:DNA polymerase epsilon subunit n=1 Tax=Saccoglossus kowalevskii TaxID=10224 RepID=A0ABM0GM13_SACKO|nr:PREDICTED: DNA polymerase epsilon subunit 2-like [Saccoglossus kowalevskii]
MATKLKSEVVSAFKMNGLSLKSDASKFLVEALMTVDDTERYDWIDRLIEAVQKQQLLSPMIDQSTIEKAIHECNADSEEDTDQIFNVINVFNAPHFVYNYARKKFVKSTSVPSLHGNADSKTAIFRERYNILHQRTSRHNLFTAPVTGAPQEQKGKKFQLKPVEFLLGSTSKLGEIIVLGMLTQLKEGKYFLEDPTGAVQLDLSQADFHSGLFTENCFVLAEGWYEDEVFHINAFGFPPPEPADTTRSYFGSINFFGGPSATSVKTSQKLKTIEKDNEDAIFVFLSDVWLDQLQVRQKLQALFSGFADVPPTAFVFCGNFSSAPYGSHHIKALKDSLHELSVILTEFPTLVKESKFVFVPGPQDPGPGHILPRPPLSECITEEFRKKVPTSIFATNPCRIQYCTQEIVVFKEDIVNKMCRNCVRFPSASSEIPAHFAKTVISQGHLCPLPLHVSPIYWAYDNALRIYPLPDLIVFADKYEAFTVNSVNCICTNTGSFPRSDFGFKVYYPSSKQVEDSKIPD